MDEHAITDWILRSLPGVETTSALGYTFFFHGADRRLPFATIATADNEYDRASNLDRPGVFRLNVGVGRESYLSRFGPKPPRSGPRGVVDTGHDFTALDQLMPHPVYAPQWWVCVLNPGDETFAAVQPLLREAYERAVQRHDRAAAREKE
ncbi:MAG TPA: DUF6194 family protein [Longimicrobium sp.]